MKAFIISTWAAIISAISDDAAMLPFKFIYIIIATMTFSLIILYFSHGLPTTLVANISSSMRVSYFST